MGSTFTTTYDGMLVVGLRERSWQAFDNGQGETVPAGAKFYLQVTRPNGKLNAIGEVLIDGETAAELSDLGYGTVVNISGSPYKEGRNEMIRAEAIEVVQSADAG